MSQERDGEGFLTRWSRRKRQGSEEGGEAGSEEGESGESGEKTAAATNEGPAKESPPEQSLPEAAPQTEEQALEILRQDDPELAEQLAAIDIDSLGESDDFTVFMKSRVPDMIRRRALNRLWSVKPIYSHLDGLNEYDEDYTDAAMLVGEFKSAWQPGKGYGSASGAGAEKDLSAMAEDLEEDGNPEDGNAEEGELEKADPEGAEIDDDGAEADMAEQQGGPEEGAEKTASESAPAKEPGKVAAGKEPPEEEPAAKEPPEEELTEKESGAAKKPGRAGHV